MSSLRALVVGAGGMGRAWVRTIRESDVAHVVGWVDIVPGRAECAAAELGLSDVLLGEDLQRALEQLGPDFVVDVTVPEAHRDVTLASLGAGVPVLGEKPMADSMGAAREMVRASEEAGKLYMVSQSRRYNPRIVAYRELLGAIGPLGILNVDFYIGAHFGGFRDEMPSPLLLDMAIHTFDQARYLSGADPVSVWAEEFSPSWSWYAGDACASALFEMSGGLRLNYRGSWCAEGLMTSWEGNWRGVGSLGTAVWDGHGAPQAERVTRTEGFHSEVETLTGDVPEHPHQAIAGSLREFVNAVQTGAQPMGECHDNIKSLAMVFGAIESARTGRRIEIEPLWTG